MPTPLISGAFSRSGLYDEWPELATCSDEELRASLVELALKKRNEKNEGTCASAKTWLQQNHEKIEQKEHEQSEPDAEKGGTPRSSRKSESESVEETDMGKLANKNEQNEREENQQDKMLELFAKQHKDP